MSGWSGQRKESAMSDSTTATVDTPWWTVPDDPTAAAILDAQMRIIDAAVRSARRHDWCSSFEAVMNQAFPDGPPDGSAEYVDSDGISCRGMDRNGYAARSGDDEFDVWGRDAGGYDRGGRDRDGYGRDGFDAAGFNRDGVNRDGLRRDSEEYRARFRYDRYGYDRDGYNQEGYDREGNPRATVEVQGGVYRFDAEGYDTVGYNRYGFDRDGYDQAGVNRYGERRRRRY
jgi:hypothetical protein